MDMEALTRGRFPDSESGREVVTVGDPSSTRPVILLHELGGLSPATIDYAATLVEHGCVVHLPLIFGSVGQQSAAKGVVQLCWGRQLAMLLADRRPKLAGWLADFTDQICRENGRAPVVIGMCATGGVVFSVLMRDSVGGAVAAQPAFPYRLRWSKGSIATLGSTVEDVEASIESGKPFVALRYAQDAVCPAGRLAQIAGLFGDESTLQLDGKGHSTLVYDPAEPAQMRVLALLDEVFGPRDGGS